VETWHFKRYLGGLQASVMECSFHMAHCEISWHGDTSRSGGQDNEGSEKLWGSGVHLCSCN